MTGSIPTYAAGSLYRTGPGGYKVPHDGHDVAVDHWFDGYTVVHRFEITAPSEKEPVKVNYVSYRHVDELIEQVRRTGKGAEMSFANKRDPCDGLFQKVKSLFVPPASPQGAHEANIGVVVRKTLPAELEQVSSKVDLGDRKILTLTTDTASAKAFDADTLEPLGVASQSGLHPELTGVFSGAHAEHDPVTGDVFNYNLAVGKDTVYKIWRASPSTGKVDVLANISGKGIKGAYLHSMLLTDNFVILCIWPAYYKMSGLSILWNHNMLESIDAFDAKSKSKWFVVDRRHGRGVVKSFESDPFFCFHTVNAWEQKAADGTVDIFCDLIQYNDLAVLHKFYYENMVSNGPGVESYEGQYGFTEAALGRYKLGGVPTGAIEKPATGEAERVLLLKSPHVGDLPRINPNYSTKEHRYVWTVIGRGKSSFIDGLAKADTKTGTSIVWEHDKHTPGEPIFVPRPGATAEDDGVILVVVLDGERGTSYLLCLDAATMKEVGRADVGYPVGLGFHGAFMANL